MNLIIKGDTSGVVEAIKGALQVRGQWHTSLCRVATAL